MILELKNLRKKFSNGRGIDGISLSIMEGDIFGLLGANGAGKTTTMKIVAGLMTKNSGEVNVFGEPLEENFQSAMSRIGCLIETPAFYPYMTALGNLETAARYYGAASDRAALLDLLNIVRMLPYKNDKAGRFSQGMKQRLALAMAMVGSPSFYVLDEPSNGLDIEGIIEIRNIILDMAQRQRATFLVSSHQSAEIQKLCNKVAVIHQGHVNGCAEMGWILENFPTLEDYYIYCVRGGNQGAGANLGERAF